MSRRFPYQETKELKKQNPFIDYQLFQYGFGDNAVADDKKRVSFGILRRYAEEFDILRACIDVRKNVIAQLEWSIVPKDHETEKDMGAQIEEATTFFKTAVRGRSFKDLLTMAIEDLSTLDAVAWYKHRARNGKLLALIPMDAAKIELIVDKSGMLPLPPEPAYQFVMNGTVKEIYTTDELIYEMQNPRTDSPYGRSPIESLITTIDSYLSVQNYNLKYFTDGTIPPGVINAASEWGKDDIQGYQTYLDNTLEGKAKRLHKLLIIPHGASYAPVNRRDDMFFKELQLFSVKTTCALLGVAPSQIGFTDDVNKATAQSQEENLRIRALRPLALFFQELLTSIINNDLGFTDLEFKFSLETEDLSKAADFYQKTVPYGIIGVDEARKELGYEPIGIGNYIQNATGAQFLDEDINQDDKQEDQSDEEDQIDENMAAKNEILTWRKRALRDIKHGKDYTRAFTTKYLSEDLKAEIYARLSKSQTKEDIFDVFSDIERNAWVYRSIMNQYAH